VARGVDDGVGVSVGQSARVSVGFRINVIVGAGVTV
jgi:hypothetical protein